MNNRTQEKDIQLTTNQVAITGIGVIAPNGVGKEEFWNSLIAGKTGIRRITSFDPSPFPCTVAGEIPSFNPTQFMDAKKARRFDRFVQLALAATKMAVSDADIELEKMNSDEIGVSCGTATAGQGWVFQQYEIFKEKGYKKLNPFTAASTFPNASSSIISMEFGVHGPSVTFSSGCASGAEAIGYAMDSIRMGRANTMIVCASEALLYPPIFGSYCATRLLTKLNGDPVTTPRPFDKNRDGIVLSEGSAALILENLETAKMRRAKIYAELVGYGETCDAYHPIAQDPSGEQLHKAMALAIKEARVTVQQIDYIKLHGTGDINADIVETKAIKSLFGDYAKKIPMSSIKSMIGHCQGACAPIEVAASALAIQNGIIPPTINYTEPDPECDLDYCPNKAREATVKFALANTFGFGGKNVSIVLKKPTNTDDYAS